MLKLNDKSKLKYFIKKYNINNLFTTNIEEYMDLYFFKKGSHICEKGDILDKFYLTIFNTTLSIILHLLLLFSQMLILN